MKQRMKSSELKTVITDCLLDFYSRRVVKLSKLKLLVILRRKNPYLFKAIGKQNATELVEGVLSAYLSSSEETIFGDAFFEPVAKAVSGGVVSPSEGVDIAVETPDKYLAISVKSGPNPYNSSQKRKQDLDFKSLRARVAKLKKQFDAMLGHCYGKTRSEPSSAKIYRDRSGQEFWEELTGDPQFYVKLIEYMEDEIINKHKDEYQIAWDKAVNRYVGEFVSEFCYDDGGINWEKLVEFNSGKRKPEATKKRTS
jgi:hypothetical protein